MIRKCDRVFLSGPFNGEQQLAVERNILTGLEAVLFCIEHGIDVTCPNMLGIYPSMRSVPYEIFIHWVLTSLMPNCRVFVQLPGWKLSPGAMREHSRAQELGLHIISWDEYRQLFLTGAIA